MKWRCAVHFACRLLRSSHQSIRGKASAFDDALDGLFQGLAVITRLHLARIPLERQAMLFLLVEGGVHHVGKGFDALVHAHLEPSKHDGDQATIGISVEYYPYYLIRHGFNDGEEKGALPSSAGTTYHVEEFTWLRVPDVGEDLLQKIERRQSTHASAVEAKKSEIALGHPDASAVYHSSRKSIAS